MRNFFLTFFEHNENDPLGDGPGDVDQGRRELLYHLLCYVIFLWLLFTVFIGDANQNLLVFMCLQYDPVSQDAYNFTYTFKIIKPCFIFRSSWYQS